MNKLVKYKYKDYTPSKSLYIETNISENKTYNEILKLKLDGFYFSKALHIYGFCDDNFHNIEYINTFFKNKFNFINSKDLILFGCDLFGNQFCFKENKIGFLNIETGETELIAENFEDWVNVLLNDYNYYTGVQILNEWEELMLPLKITERFVPIKPFVIGGEYSPKNMRAIEFFETLDYNSSLAKQIYNLPDGTPIELVTGIPKLSGK